MGNGMCRLVICVLLFCGNMFAQLPSNPQDRCVWDGKKIIVLYENFFTSYRAEVFDHKNVSIEKIPPPPRVEGPYPGRAHYVDGRFLFARSHKVVTEKETFMNEEILEYVDKRWELIAFYRHPKGLIELFPIHGDLFVGITMHAHALENNGKSYPFGLFRLGNKRDLILSDVFDANLEKPFFNSSHALNYPNLVSSIISGQCSFTDKCLVVGGDYGHFWVFNADNGNFIKLIRLFPNVTDRILEKNELFPGILGFQPRQDGDILIASRSEDAVLNAWKTFPRPDDGVIKKTLDWLGQTNKFNPMIYWWILEPTSGKFYEVAKPYEVIDRLHKNEDIMNFNWRFKYDGNLYVYGMNEKFPKPSKEDVERVYGPQHK
jgi:hypothetical protein